MITPIQCRMARAALDLGVRDLAKIADVSPNTIARLERGEALHSRTLAFIQGALEAQGVTFIPAGSASARGGFGVCVGHDGQRSNYAKLLEALWALPDFRTNPEEAYIALIGVFEQYLDIIQNEGRDPDVWERVDLNDALNALNRSSIFLAFAYLQHGVTPPDNQSSDYPISPDVVASVANLDLSYFRRCIAQLRTRGYKPSRNDP